VNKGVWGLGSQLLERCVRYGHELCIIASRWVRSESAGDAGSAHNSLFAWTRAACMLHIGKVSLIEIVILGLAKPTGTAPSAQM
jgi:hypothetical protein